jgi:hypothetical protein
VHDRVRTRVDAVERVVPVADEPERGAVEGEPGGTVADASLAATWSPSIRTSWRSASSATQTAPASAQR